MPNYYITCCFAALLSSSTFLQLHVQTLSHDKAAQEAGLGVESLNEMDVALQKQIDDKHVAGVIGLIGRHGKVGYFEAFGYRNLKQQKPMTEDALFRIYSMTKPMVAVTAMSLWEEGKFQLDDPISVFCPEWKNAATKNNGKLVPVTTPVTARHLMTHSSGLSYDKNGVDLGEATSLKKFSESLEKKTAAVSTGHRLQIRVLD